MQIAVLAVVDERGERGVELGAVGVGNVGERIVGRRLAVQDLVQPLVRVHDRTVAVDVQQTERHGFGDAAQ